MTKQDFFSRYTYNVRNDKIGGGSFGTVYKAYDNLLHREVAIKVSEVKIINGKEFSLKDEFDAIKNLPKHPNIANYEELHTFDTPQGVFDYAVMQFYPEGNLSSCIGRGLSFEQKEEICVKLLQGISHLHNNRVVHRDLKPANILIAKYGDKIFPLITDFGLSKQIWEDAQSKFSMSFGGGTLKYSSPEQLKGEQIRFNTDLWSYGVIVYEIFTGTALFKQSGNSSSAEAEKQILEQILSKELNQIISTLPTKWQKVANLCLTKDASLRIKSADELLKFIESGEIEAPIIAEKDQTIIQNPNSNSQDSGSSETIIEENVNKKTAPNQTIGTDKSSITQFWPIFFIFLIGGSTFSIFELFYNLASWFTLEETINRFFDCDTNAYYALVSALFNGLFLSISFAVVFRRTNEHYKWALATFASFAFAAFSLYISEEYYAPFFILSYFLIPVSVGIILSFFIKTRNFWKYIILPWSLTIIVSVFMQATTLAVLEESIPISLPNYSNLLDVQLGIFLALILGIFTYRYLNFQSLENYKNYNNKNFVSFVSAFIIATILYFVGIIILSYGEMQIKSSYYYSNEEYSYSVALGLSLFLFSAYIFIISLIYHYIIVYNAWKTIKIKQPEINPAKMTGLLFIPGFNIYWRFIAYYSLFKKFNIHKKNKNASSSLALAFCIIYLIPFINILAIVLLPIITAKIDNNTLELEKEIDINN